MLKFIPGSTITQGFGPSKFDYARFGITKNKGYFHDGQDEAAKIGTKVPAPESGEVTYQGWEPGGAGNFVILKTASGYELLLMHLSKFPGYGKKAKGEAIGYLGSTGNSTGPHTHFTVYPRFRKRLNGVRGAIDPQAYLGKITKKGNKMLEKQLKDQKTVSQRMAYALAGQFRKELTGKLGTDAQRRKYINFTRPSSIQKGVAEDVKKRR